MAKPVREKIRVPAHLTNQIHDKILSPDLCLAASDIADLSFSRCEGRSKTFGPWNGSYGTFQR